MLGSVTSRCALIFALVLAVVHFCAPCNAASHQLKRRVAPKPAYEKLPDHADCNLIVVKLREGTVRPLLVNGRFAATGPEWDQLNAVLSASNGTLKLRPRLTLEPARLDEMRADGSKRIGWQLPDLSLYYEIQLNDSMTGRDRLNLVNRVNRLKLVEIAYFAPLTDLQVEPVKDDRPDPEPPPTPSFEYGQYYLQPAPIGFDAYYAWSFPGGHGENVKIIDLEYNWNETHEDLRGGSGSFLIAGDIDSSDNVYLYHGTAVLGIIAADSNDFGMTGISYNAGLGTVALTNMTVADGIATASANANQGDIILLMVANVYASGYYVLAEYEQATFDAILTASALGQLVVAVAGNSNADYDDTELFDSLFYPDYRFSGAIVTAMSTAFHVPDQRTCYGSRIDVHGFGSYDVYTLGGGTLWGTEENNYYTQGFSGTSSASAEIAGVCAAAQGVYQHHTGSTLDHAAMRDLLTTYSTPQAEHYKTIGPMPDLAGVCDAITGFARPAPPVLVSPDDGASFGAPAQPALDWSDVPGATAYDVMVDDNFNFTSPVAYEQGVTNSQWSSPDLLQGKYFWRVRAVNANGFGSWSDVRTLLVDVQIAAPVLLSPEDGGVVKPRVNVPVEWYPVDGVVDYVVEVDDLPDFQDPVRSTYSLPCEDGSCSYGISSLFQTTYYWRVKILGDNCPWSEVWSFKPRGPSKLLRPDAHTETGDELRNVVLCGNYPNPFNPTTDIQFSLPEAGHVTLEIFNIMGQKIATLLDSRMEAGSHSVTWDGSKAASGVYLYRLTAGGSVESKKMILVK